MSVTLRIEYTHTTNIPFWGNDVPLIQLTLNTTDLESIKDTIQSMSDLSSMQKQTVYYQFLPFFRYELPNLLLFASSKNVYTWAGPPTTILHRLSNGL
jgi:hypothetical protein